MGKQKLITITAKDCRWDYYRGSGKGGQKRNKTSNCVRCTHAESGAVGKAEEGRSQIQNRKKAFRRMTETKEFKNWIKFECAKACGDIKEIEERVDKFMSSEYLKIEIKNENGEWTQENE